MLTPTTYTHFSLFFLSLSFSLSLQYLSLFLSFSFSSLFTDPGGAHVGANYTEWFRPAKIINEDQSFTPTTLLPIGYYAKQKEHVNEEKRKQVLKKERNLRIARRSSICELCDNAIITGRTILKNEELSSTLKEKKGLVTLVKITCNAMLTNYKEEVPWLDCDHIDKQMWSHYNDKYIGNVKIPSKCQNDCPKTKKVRRRKLFMIFINIHPFD